MSKDVLCHKFLNKFLNKIESSNKEIVKMPVLVLVNFKHFEGTKQNM